MVTMLSDADAVLDTAERALAALDRTAIWIQMSTIGIDATSAAPSSPIAPACLRRRPGARNSRARRAGRTGDPGLGTESARAPVSRVRSDRRRARCGLARPGAGSRLKVVINGWIVGVVAVLAETITLAEALDVDPQLFFDAVADGPLDLPYARMKGAAMSREVIRRPLVPACPVAQGRGPAAGAAAQAGIELPVMEAVVKRLAGSQRQPATVTRTWPRPIGRARRDRPLGATGGD